MPEKFNIWGSMGREGQLRAIEKDRKKREKDAEKETKESRKEIEKNAKGEAKRRNKTEERGVLRGIIGKEKAPIKTMDILHEEALEEDAAREDVKKNEEAEALRKEMQSKKWAEEDALNRESDKRVYAKMTPDEQAKLRKLFPKRFSEEK